jgi:hypothetical protein
LGRNAYVNLTRAMIRNQLASSAAISAKPIHMAVIIQTFLMDCNLN